MPCKTRISSSGRCLGAGWTASAKRARTCASIRSVLASRPVAPAKSRTWRGLTTATGSPMDGGQSPNHSSLETASGLQDHKHGALLNRARERGIDSSIVVWDNEGVLVVVSSGFASAHTDVEAILREVHPYVNFLCCRRGIRKSSLLLSHSGPVPLRIRAPLVSHDEGAQATVRALSFQTRKARRPLDFFAVFILVDQGRSRSVAPSWPILRPQTRYKGRGPSVGPSPHLESSSGVSQFWLTG